MDGAPRLDDLIDLVHASAASDDPIDELEAAASLKADLDELTDALLGHFVDQARRAGRSWTQIGAALGVSKQAAQQRHASATAFPVPRQLMTRFTERARATVDAAQGVARSLGHGYIGTEHLLLAQFTQPGSIAAKVLAEAGIERAALEAKVLEIVERDEVPDGALPFTPRAKTCLELAMREALTLGHNYLGTEHILLGILQEGKGLACQVLPDSFTVEAARAAVVRHLTAS
jgi:hypothetical protein